MRANVPDPRQVYDLRRIAKRYDLRSMSGTDAVRLARDAQGRVTGQIDGVPSFRDGKITRVEQWLADQGRHLGQFERVSFYSDSPNDLPLLERATDPVATNPSTELEAVAQARGWRILRLFA